MDKETNPNKLGTVIPSSQSRSCLETSSGSPFDSMPRDMQPPTVRMKINNPYICFNYSDWYLPL